MSAIIFTTNCENVNECYFNGTVENDVSYIETQNFYEKHLSVSNLNADQIPLIMNIHPTQSAINGPFSFTPNYSINLLSTFFKSFDLL